jgi:hypothetical protein
MSPIARLFFLLAAIALVLAFHFKSATFHQLRSSWSSFQSYLGDSQVSSDITLSFTRKIVAVGDLHGDLPNALKVLQMAHVVDAHGNWSGEIDFFVQTGDIIDR